MVAKITEMNIALSAVPQDKYSPFYISMDNIFKACHWSLSLHSLYQLLISVWLISLIAKCFGFSSCSLIPWFHGILLLWNHVALCTYLVSLLPLRAFQFPSISLYIRVFVNVSLLFENSFDIEDVSVITAVSEGSKTNKIKWNPEYQVVFKSSHEEVLILLNVLLSGGNMSYILKVGHN